MPETDNLNLLEQQARYLLAHRKIPGEKKDILERIMKDSTIEEKERYRAIIDLLVDEEEAENEKKGQKRKKKVKKAIDRSALGPTEESYYVEDILRKYKNTRFFRKRYFARRNNRIGVGCRKRCIPTKKLLACFQDIASMQETITAPLPEIFLTILNDPDIEDPTVFNYLRLLRKWMLTVPFAGTSHDTIRWMERHHFERELKEYVRFFFSFFKLDQEEKERIIQVSEETLRQLKEYSKLEINPELPDAERKYREKENLNREKTIYNYIQHLRSFLPATLSDDTILNSMLLKRYGMDSLSELLFMVLEALVYQRSFDQREIYVYFEIEPPRVSSTLWDYSEDLLRKVGKDPGARSRKRKVELEEALQETESMHRMLEVTAGGKNILHSAVNRQWKYVDHKRYDAEEVYRDNYFSYLDGLINYFKNTYMQIMNGSPFWFKDPEGNSVEGMIFEESFLREEQNRLNEILEEMHFFKSNNPTLAISREEVQKIMKGVIKSMVHVERFVIMLGGFFYSLAFTLQQVYDMHRRWQRNDSRKNELSREPLGIDERERLNKLVRPIPFHDCALTGLEKNEPLMRNLQGRQIMDPKMDEGLFVRILAFCYQTARECMNPDIERDLEKRKELERRLKDYSKDHS